VDVRCVLPGGYECRDNGAGSGDGNVLERAAKLFCVLDRSSKSNPFNPAAFEYRVQLRSARRHVLLLIMECVLEGAAPSALSPAATERGPPSIHPMTVLVNQLAIRVDRATGTQIANEVPMKDRFVLTARLRITG